MLNLGLKGKKVLITGGSRGMGRSAAIMLAECGADIAVNFAGNTEAAEKTVAECKAHGVDAFAIRADVAEVDQVNTMIDTVVERFGRLDVLVHSAGLADCGADPEGWRKTFAVHMDSTHWLAQKALPIMKDQGGGNYIVISSIAAHTTGPAGYCAAMAGKLNYAKGLAKQQAANNIRVNTISPGTIFTEMLDPFIPAEKRRENTEKNIPLWKNREGVPGPDEIGKVVVFLASDLASHVTGQDIPVNGGQDIHLL